MFRARTGWVLTSSAWIPVGSRTFVVAFCTLSQDIMATGCPGDPYRRLETKWASERNSGQWVSPRECRSCTCKLQESCRLESLADCLADCLAWQEELKELTYCLHILSSRTWKWGSSLPETFVRTTKLHGDVTLQKTIILLLIAVGVWNLTAITGLSFTTSGAKTSRSALLCFIPRFTLVIFLRVTSQGSQ
jgi:hypothetical protein